jgi:hypothetical protein
MDSTRWIDVSAYECDRKRTKNRKFASYVRAKHKAKVESEMFQKVVFD